MKNSLKCLVMFVILAVTIYSMGCTPPPLPTTPEGLCNDVNCKSDLGLITICLGKDTCIQRTCKKQEDCLLKGSTIGFLCVNQQCKQQVCKTDLDCDAGLSCKKGTCHQTEECNNNDDCNNSSTGRDYSTKCKEGSCIRRTCIYKKGSCVGDDKKSCFTCQKGQYCEHGFRNKVIIAEISFCRFEHTSTETTNPEPSTKNDGGTEVVAEADAGEPNIEKPPTEQPPIDTNECKNEETRPCITPELSKICKPSLDGKNYNCQGQCKAGIQKCVDGNWEKVCYSETGPANKEICGNKVDDDCNGIIDDASQCAKPDCKQGQTRPCYSGSKGCQSNTCSGICRTGLNSCKADGKWDKVCKGEILPEKEVCDNIDNDCDGKTDNGITCQCQSGQKQNCYTGPKANTGIGSCTMGTQTCISNKWSTCLGSILPKSESCDGKDNDCNGKIDDKLTRSCYSGSANNIGKGFCKGGTQTCNAGKWSIKCIGEILPSNEASAGCDGKDNDCDGFIDEDIKRNCKTNMQGVCTPGEQICNAGLWKACVQNVLASAEKCDGNDNNCDGKVDNDPKCNPMACNPGTKRPCYTATSGCSKSGNSYKCNGPCKAGTQTCTNAGAWGICTGQISPVSEIADSKDNDCDGFVDNGTNYPTMKLVTIKAKCPSTFMSGSPVTETGRDTDEKQYPRCFSYSSVLVSAYETKATEYKSLIGLDPSGRQGCSGTNCPVNNITWHNAATYANKLSQAYGLAKCFNCSGGLCSEITPAANYISCKGYRLPTSYEWEYFARAGTTGKYYGTLSQVANCGSGLISPAGLKLPNAYGLYNILGNLNEWTAGWYKREDPTLKDPMTTTIGSYRNIRGGSFTSGSDCRAANITKYRPTSKSLAIGFRVIRVLK